MSSFSTTNPSRTRNGRSQRLFHGTGEYTTPPKSHSNIGFASIDRYDESLDESLYDNLFMQHLLYFSTLHRRTHRTNTGTDDTAQLYARSPRESIPKKKTGATSTMMKVAPTYLCYRNLPIRSSMSMHIQPNWFPVPTIPAFSSNPRGRNHGKPPSPI